MTLPPRTSYASDDLRQRVHRALKAFQHAPASSQPLAGLRLVHARQSIGADLLEAERAVLLAALTQLAEQAPQAAQLLHQRFVQNQTAAAVAIALDVSDAEFYRRQQHAIDLLAGVVQEQEEALWGRARVQALARLETPTYNQLIGVEECLDHLQQLLLDDAGSALICVTGLGGLGKTALVDALLRRMVDQNCLWHLAWVTARQRNFALDGELSALRLPTLSSARLVEALWDQLLPHLPSPAAPLEGDRLGELELHLRNLPHSVVVIDNLETAEDLAGLLPLLRRLAHPLKFLLTSRRQLLAGGHVYHYPLRALSREHALELVRSEARIRNLPAVYSADDESLGRIYTVVGGHPLALRLVVGQLHLRSLPEVLGEMACADMAGVENLYAFIYEQGWRQLDETARCVLLAMPQAAAAGAAADFLAAITGLPLPAVKQGLAQLVKLSLVDRRGDLESSRYSIHGLTRTFLLANVLRANVRAAGMEHAHDGS